MRHHILQDTVYLKLQSSQGLHEERACWQGSAIGSTDVMVISVEVQTVGVIHELINPRIKRTMSNDENI